MKKLKFNKLAKSELRESIHYYNSIRETLGIEFFQEVKSGLNSIRNFPEANIDMDESIKKYVLKRFPFSIFYWFNDEVIFIIAILYQRRKPGYWKSRFS